MFVFEATHRKVYAQTVHGRSRRLIAGIKQIVVSLLVAEAHEQTMRALVMSLWSLNQAAL